MLDTCGDAENKLAMELSQHEVQIEREILEPLSVLTEVSHSSLTKEVWILTYKPSKNSLSCC